MTATLNRTQAMIGAVRLSPASRKGRKTVLSLRQALHLQALAELFQSLTQGQHESHMTILQDILKEMLQIKTSLDELKEKAIERPEVQIRCLQSI